MSQWDVFGIPQSVSSDLTSLKGSFPKNEASLIIRSPSCCLRRTGLSLFAAWDCWCLFISSVQQLVSRYSSVNYTLCCLIVFISVWKSAEIHVLNYSWLHYVRCLIQWATPAIVPEIHHFTIENTEFTVGSIRWWLLWLTKCASLSHHSRKWIVLCRKRL